MIYLDSSALLKLLVEESESAALAGWLSERASIPAISSELARLEVIRAARRLDPVVVPAARTLMSQIDLLPLGGEIMMAAAEVGGPDLRSLDAIHLASALAVRDDLSAFVAYDRRLVVAATGAGLEVERPGVRA